MRRTLGRLALLGAGAGAVLVLRGYLRDVAGRSRRGDVQVVLDDGATTVEPEAPVAEEFAGIARRILEIGAP